MPAFFLYTYVVFFVLVDGELASAKHSLCDCFLSHVRNVLCFQRYCVCSLHFLQTTEIVAIETPFCYTHVAFRSF